MMTDLFIFHVGDRVEHVGDYQCFGIVRARGNKGDGQARYLVEIELIPGMIMVYSERQLRIANRLADDGVSLL